MTWDEGLARDSEQWAMKLARENGLRHSRGSYGENLYAAWGQTASCAQAILSWYNEIKYYDFNRGGFSSRTGHFTQVVWKGSTKLGVGIATRGRMVVVVARYSPAGNFRGRYRENVLRQKSGAKVPSLAELESGVVRPATERPRPEPPVGPATERPGPEPPVPETDAPAPSSNLCLSAHNALRALHQDTPPLTWDEGLARDSEQWGIKLARENGLRHSRGNYGENLYAAWGQSASCAKAILSWYNEIKDYNYNRGGYQSGTGHFTQIIWKGTTKVGAAVVKRGNIVVVVARYTPRGNFIGRFGQNVLRQKPGARIPSLSELESGVTVPVTGGPQPPVPQTQKPWPPSNCSDKSRLCQRYRWKCRSSPWIRDRCKKTCGVC